MIAKGCINGVDVDQLSEVMDELKSQPELARFRFRATNRWVDGAHSRAFVQDFYGAGQEDTSRSEPMIFDEDEPPVLLGQNRGANPVEYVLTALSGCLMTALVTQTAARGVQLRHVECRLEGDLDVRGFLGLADDVRNGYQQIRVEFDIDSDAPRETLEELVKAAQQRSPVFDVVTRPVPVSVELAS